MAARQRRLKQLKEERAAESSRQAEKKAAEEAAAEEELAEVESRDVRAGLGGLFRRGWGGGGMRTLCSASAIRIKASFRGLSL